MASRKLDFLSIKDSNVYSFVDGGPDRNGENTSTRSALLRNLDKRVEVDGQMLPVFRLASAPLFSDPHFDSRYLLDGNGGGYLLGKNYPQWWEARQGFLAAREKADAETQAKAETVIGEKMTRAMVELTRTINKKGGGV